MQEIGGSGSFERRANRRVPVSLDAVLFYNSLMLPECRVCDVSLEGAFVAMQGGHFPRGANIDLVLSVSSLEAALPRFSALVMRVTEEGVGLRIEHPNAQSLRRLVEALYAL